MLRVTIVGVGALGSHVALMLRNAAKLRIIDFDRIEMKNTQAQFHGLPNVGKNKAQALSATMKLLFDTKMEVVPHKLTVDNTQQLLGDSDLVIDCLDNAESRLLVKDYCHRNNIPCLHGALAPGGEYGRVIWSELFTIDSEAGMGQATCEDGEHLPFIMWVSSMIAATAKVFLQKGSRYNYEIGTHSIRMI
jgi:molybdopterin/thiamine biosynthesis adenylyltransferase